ncbi:hypothetical protein AD948_04105 [Acetobacter senegalensis]|nr:hypothetical protein AD948_04105 [Acetobacter senegalensis]
MEGAGKGRAGQAFWGLKKRLRWSGTVTLGHQTNHFELHLFKLKNSSSLSLGLQIGLLKKEEENSLVKRPTR